MKIEVVPFNPNWKEEFIRLKTHLLTILKDFSIRIEHVGSTSVPGLAAKPIIDIAIGVHSMELLDDVVNPMMEAGFIYYEAFNITMPQRRLFVGLKAAHHLTQFPRKFTVDQDIPHEAINELRLCHIHVWVLNSPDWIRHVAFRDYLIHSPEVIAAYGELKLQLAQQDWENGMEYNKAKDAFIKEHEKRAIAEWTGKG